MSRSKQTIAREKARTARNILALSGNLPHAYDPRTAEIRSLWPTEVLIKCTLVRCTCGASFDFLEESTRPGPTQPLAEFARLPRKRVISLLPVESCPTCGFDGMQGKYSNAAQLALPLSEPSPSDLAEPKKISLQALLDLF